MIMGLAHTETEERPGNPLMQNPFWLISNSLAGWAQQAPVNTHGDLISINFF